MGVEERYWCLLTEVAIHTHARCGHRVRRKEYIPNYWVCEHCDAVVHNTQVKTEFKKRQFGISEIWS